MTVSAVSPIKTLVYTGIGSYDFPFLAYDVADLVVTHISSAGVSTVLSTGDYNATTQAPNNGGTVNVTSAAYGTTGQLQLSRVLSIEQSTDWVNNDAFDMDLLERTQDEIVMMIQQVAASANNVLSSITWRGVWVDGVVYEERDMVEAPDGNWYSCLVGHTSDVSFNTDLASGYWVLALDLVQVQTYVAQAEQAQLAAQDAQEAAELAQASSQLSEVEAGISAAEALTSEGNSAINAQNAANCNAEAYQAQIAAEDAAASIPDPSTIVRQDVSTGAAFIPSGTTAERPTTPAYGYTRFNEDLFALEVWSGTAWVLVGAGASGGVGNPFVYENDILVTESYSIPSGKNGVTAGPIEVADGAVVTVPTGSTWTVV